MRALRLDPVRSGAKLVLLFVIGAVGGKFSNPFVVMALGQDGKIDEKSFRRVAVALSKAGLANLKISATAADIRKRRTHRSSGGS
jgi:hypothetical protein